MPAPRLTQRSKYSELGKKYRAWKEEIKFLAKTKGLDLKKSGGVITVCFFLKTPPSISRAEKSRRLHKPHTIRPDLSNLIKAFEDALCQDDSYIHTYQLCQKKWGEEDKIVVKM